MICLCTIFFLNGFMYVFNNKNQVVITFSVNKLQSSIFYYLQKYNIISTILSMILLLYLVLLLPNIIIRIEKAGVLYPAINWLLNGNVCTFKYSPPFFCHSFLFQKHRYTFQIIKISFLLVNIVNIIGKK